MAKLVIQRGRFFQKYDLAAMGDVGLTIGRGYDCDLVLEDRFVDPIQVRVKANNNVLATEGMSACGDEVAPESDPESITKDEAGWVLSLGQSTNPVFLNGKLLRRQQANLVSGDRLTLGRTTLQLFSAEHQVPRTDRFVLSNWLTHHAIGPWRALLALFAVMALALLTQYWTHYEENQWRSFVSGTLVPPGILVAWVCAWAFVGRLLRGHPLFFPHLFFAALGACVLLVFWDIHGYVAFATNNEWLALIADTAVFSIVVGVTLGCQLSLASRIRHVFSTGILICLGLAVVAGVLSLSSQERWTSQAQHNTALKAPFVPSPAGISVDDFIAGYDDVAEMLAESATEVAEEAALVEENTVDAEPLEGDQETATGTSK